MQQWRPWLVILGAALAAWLVAGPAANLSVFASSSGSSTSSAATTAGTHAGPVPPAPPGPRPEGPGVPGRGRPRGRGPGPGAVPGLAGTIAGVSASGFSMTVAGATYQVEVSSSTAYLLAPGWTTTLSALASGDQVAVQGTVSGQQVAATAVTAHIWGITAQVTAVSGDAATVTEPSGRTATLQFGSVPSLSPGHTVQAVGRWAGDALTVRAWRVLPDRVDGTVTALGTNSATLQTGAGSTVEVTWSSATTFAAGPKTTASASAVTVGSRVHAEGTLSGDTLQATLIGIGPKH